MTIKEIIIKRDGLIAAEADKVIQDAQFEFDRLLATGETEEAYNICESAFGLEPDYIEEFIH